MGLAVVLLIIGFILLIKGADYLIEGSVSVAEKYGVPKVVVGLTVVALGTSLPELVVNVFASISGEGSLVYGNVLGSNIANILLILGVVGVISPIAIEKDLVKKEIPISLAITILVYFISKDGILSRVDGMILLGLFIAFIVYIFTKDKGLVDEVVEDGAKKGTMVTVMIVGGMIGLLLGGKLVVDSAVKIALYLGISKEMVSLTIVSIGTSLPELTSSVVAAKKGEAEIAIGNVVGSNIFNILLILGVSGAIKGIDYSYLYNKDITVLLYGTILLIVFSFLTKEHKIGRKRAFVFLLSYTIYIGQMISTQL